MKLWRSGLEVLFCVNNFSVAISGFRRCASREYFLKFSNSQDPKSIRTLTFSWCSISLVVKRDYAKMLKISKYFVQDCMYRVVNKLSE